MNREILIKSIFAVLALTCKTASIVLGTLAESFWENSADGLLQTSWRTNHRSVDVGWTYSSNSGLLYLEVVGDVTNYLNNQKDRTHMGNNKHLSLLF